jgi:hypothetical protein
MVAPPSRFGAAKFTVNWVFPGVTLVIVGASGATAEVLISKEVVTVAAGA